MQDSLYTIPNDCGCCQETGCRYIGGCSCNNEDGTPNSQGISIGYWCQLCSPVYITHTCTTSGYYQKCDPDNPGSLMAVVCDRHEYTTVLLTVPDAIIGNNNCNIGGSYVLTNYGRPQYQPGSAQTVCNAPIQPASEDVPTCQWSYGGSDIQSGPDPLTRCTEGVQMCTECPIVGPTFSYPYYRGYGSVGFSFLRSSLQGNPYIVSLGIGNFMHPNSQFGNGVGDYCYPCTAQYFLPNGSGFKCSGQNTFFKQSSTNSSLCNFPSSVTVEVI